jgi:hypothetical protein
MLNPYQIDLMVRKGSSQEVMDKIKKDYPESYIVYCITHNYDQEYVKNLIKKIEMFPINWEVVFKQLAHYSEDVRIPFEILEYMGEWYGEYTEVVVDSVVDKLPLARDVIDYLVNHHEILSKVVFEREEFIPQLPLPLIKAMLNMGLEDSFTADDIAFAYRLLVECFSEELNMVKYYGEDVVNQAIKIIISEPNHARDVIEKIFLHYSHYENIEIKEIYKPIYEPIFKKAAQEFRIDGLWGFANTCAENGITIPKAIWQKIKTTNPEWMRSLEKTGHKNAKFPVPPYQESFKQYFKKICQL